jgi:hypothetical protein
MNRRFPEIGALNRAVGITEVNKMRADQFVGAMVFGDLWDGVRLVWEVKDVLHPRGIRLKPHDARALGQALIAAADDVAPYKVQP